MNRRFSRRTCIAAVPAAMAVAIGRDIPTILLAEEPRNVPSTELDINFPTQAGSIVKEVVGVSHGNFARVQELVEERPELAKAAWDWGFGDWESALGAASHTGRRNIAEYLMSKGARADLFTAAMLGHLEVVRAVIRSTPGIQKKLGPHGITLLSHARAGGPLAEPVVDFLEQIGGADDGYVDEPLEEKMRQSLVGSYKFGDAPEDRFDVDIHERFGLRVGRRSGSLRKIMHLGDLEFHPVGAYSARVRFSLVEGRIAGLTFFNPGPIVVAQRESA